MAKCIDCFLCRTQVTVREGMNHVGLLKKFWCKVGRFPPLSYLTRTVSTPYSLKVEHRCPEFDYDEPITTLQ